MANLTGEYDVATEVGVGLVNAVLAAIHENDDDAFPTLLHSIMVQVADVYRGAGDPIPETQRTGFTANAEIQLSTPTVSLPLDGRPGPDPLAQPRAAARLGRGGRGPACVPPAGRRSASASGCAPGCATSPGTCRGSSTETSASRPGIVRTDVPGLGTFLGLDHASGPDGRLRARGRHDAQRRAADSGGADRRQLHPRRQRAGDVQGRPSPGGPALRLRAPAAGPAALGDADVRT